MDNTIKLNGRKYSYGELKDIYNFFLNWEDGLALPRYDILRMIGYDEYDKELIDLSNTYEKVFKYDKLMNATHNNVDELLELYYKLRRCLPVLLDGNGKMVCTINGPKLKELEDCDDEEIVKSIQKLYNKYTEDKHNEFIKGIMTIMNKEEK
jgi:hypothetical protein